MNLLKSIELSDALKIPNKRKDNAVGKGEHFQPITEKTLAN